MSFINSTPQFGTAEYSEKKDQRCQFCEQPIAGTYYRVNSGMACPACVEKVRTELYIDRHAAFVRALAYGFGAAVLGLIGYALIAILLKGWVISYMAIGVGWLVATAMMKGSNGTGGRRYQIAAALLTYAAVSMAAIPIYIHFAKPRPVQTRPVQTDQQRQTLEDEQRQLEQEFGNQAPRPAPPKPASRPPVSVATVGAWLARIALIGLASPFLQLSGNPLWGVMGLLILFFGIRIAWKIAAGRPFQVYGPFADSAAAAR